MTSWQTGSAAVVQGISDISDYISANLQRPQAVKRLSGEDELLWMGFDSDLRKPGQHFVLCAYTSGFQVACTISPAATHAPPILLVKRRRSGTCERPVN